MAAAFPYLLAAGGAATQYDALNRAQRLKQQMMNEAMSYDSSQAAKERGLFTTQAQKYDPTSRAGALDTTTQQIASNLGSYLNKNSVVPDSPGRGGKTSADFVSAKADNALSEGNRTALITRLYSKMFAPGQMRFNEGVENANTASQAESIQADRINQQRARMFGISQIRPNTSAMLIGKIMSLAPLAMRGISAADEGDMTYPMYRGFRQPQEWAAGP